MDSLRKGTVTALEENRKAEKRKNEKDDGLFSVTLCQVIFSVIAVLSLFVAEKSGTQTAQNLKDDFKLLSEWSFSTDDFESTLKSVKEYLDSPAEISVFKLFSKDSNDDEKASSESESGAFEPEEKSSEAQTTEKEKDKKAKEESTVPETTAETTVEATTKKPAVKKTALPVAKNAGGKDLSVYKAKEGTTFSPAETTAPIVKPVSGSYTSYFGYRTNPITGSNSFHTGVDIAAAQGTKIKAAYPGKVRKVGEDSRSGKYIYLTHSDGFETLYCHCSKILAEEGAVIRQGETIALVGSTGWSTGPHLHFEVHKDKTRLDPLPILNKNDD